MGQPGELGGGDINIQLEVVALVVVTRECEGCVSSSEREINVIHIESELSLLADCDECDGLMRVRDIMFRTDVS